MIQKNKPADSIEKIEENQNPETAVEERVQKVERKECVSFVEKIKSHFVENFPFTKDEDRDDFISRFDSLLEEDVSSSQIDLDNLIKRLRQIIVTLDNSHVSLTEKNVESFKLTKEIYYKAGTFWIDMDDEPFEVIGIDNTSIISLVEEKMKEIGGGTLEWKKYKAAKELTISKKDSDVIIEVKNSKGEIIKVDAEFVKNNNKRFVTKVENDVERKYIKEDYIEAKMLDGDIGYIGINSWSNKIDIDGKNIAELVEEELEKLKSGKSIIIDVRENDGGNSHYARLIASHFVKEKIQCCRFLIKKAGQKEMVEFIGHVGPEGEFYDKKVVILTGPKCISSTDMFLMFLKDTDCAISIGQTTGGGSGNPQFIGLDLGGRNFELGVSCWRNYRNNGMEIENNGVEPDIFIEPTPEDVREHRDVELEKAVEYLKNN